MLNDTTPNADGTTFRGSCTTIVDESKVFAGPLASVKLNNLGFTPPFSIPSLPAIQVRKSQSALATLTIAKMTWRAQRLDRRLTDDLGRDVPLFAMRTITASK